MNSKKRLLLIFTRNPILGECKTRLAKKIGDEKALEVYTTLLDHTVAVTKPLEVTKKVYYSKDIIKNDRWDEDIFSKKKQQGANLGDRMKSAFKEGFEEGFKEIIIIGSDMHDLSTQDLSDAFGELANSNVVIGPAEDGGYYLLGMKSLYKQVFEDKDWGDSTVLKDTLYDLNSLDVALLSQKNDIDTYEDLQGIEEFSTFITKS
ncbi:TIGR04282 family arsenosugar biosynthesis glycosyltransferase [Gangjinia marincola]|uniref:TIGR04282 family arsenosugar biosynthesis glycosyltransferase n=1 Tax=Gangjinia marincola TaxID=578463 RepID=A0ABP3XWZ4_9FLAO